MQYQAPDSTSPNAFHLLSGETASMTTFCNYMERMSPNGYSGEDPVLEQDRIRPSVSDEAWKYLKFEAKHDLKSGITQLLAWHLNQHLPHGPWLPSVPDNSTTSDSHMEAKSILESGYQFLKRMEIPLPCQDSQCLRGESIHPCASECSDDSMCTASDYDDALLPIREWTSDCEGKVLYTTSFGSDVKSISITPPKDHCAIAFVSMDSILMKEQNKKKDQDKTMYKGWRLVPIDFSVEKDHSNHDRTSLPRELTWLPKLSPGKLFHPSIRYAIYINDNLPKSPSSEDLLFIRKLMTNDKDKRQQAMVLVSELENRMTPSTTKQDAANPNEGTIRTDAGTRDGVQVGTTTNGQDHTPSSSMSLLDAKQSILRYRGLDSQQTFKQTLQNRILLSQQAILLLNRCEFYPNCQNHHIYKYKLRHWIKTGWIVHDLHSIAAKEFRCDWYKEHTKFQKMEKDEDTKKKSQKKKNGSVSIIDDTYNDFDEVSFAHVMAIKEMEHYSFLEEEDVNDDWVDEYDTPYDMMERSKMDQVPQWISLRTKREHPRSRSYVRMVGTNELVKRRKEWDRYRKYKQNVKV